MIKNNKMKKGIFLGIIIIFILTIGVITINIQKNEIGKLTTIAKREVETQIQAIIDSVKQDKENENVNSIQTEPTGATLEDLKNKFSELGYNLDISTGEVIYGNYIVTISNELTILEIKELGTKAYFKVYEYKGEVWDGTLIVENANGIEKITIGETQYYCNNKKKVAFDKKIIEGDSFEIKVKGKNEETQRVYRLQPRIEISVVNYDTTGDGSTRTIKINYAQTENIIKKYSIDGGITWNEYTGEFDISIADVEKIAAKTQWSDTQIGTIRFDPDYECNEYTSASLLDVTKYSIGETGIYEFTINGEKYPIHAYVYNEDLTISTNTSFGDAQDIGTNSENAKNTIVVKVNGNLTINSGTTVTAYGSNYGGPKGMLIYVTGTLTNNGIVTMTARGAKALGQNVYLWKNEDGSYEYVSASGGSGGASVYNGRSQHQNPTIGKNGANGVNRATGGGGSGGAVGGYYNAANSGSGSAGTAYSGGSGGGGSFASTAENASYNGGKATSGNEPGWQRRCWWRSWKSSRF